MFISHSKVINLSLVIGISVAVNVFAQIFINSSQPATQKSKSIGTIDESWVEEIDGKFIKQNRMNGTHAKQIYTLEQRVLELNTRLKTLQENIDSANSLSDIKTKPLNDLHINVSQEGAR